MAEIPNGGQLKVPAWLRQAKAEAVRIVFVVVHELVQRSERHSPCDVVTWKQGAISTKIEDALKSITSIIERSDAVMLDGVVVAHREGVVTRLALTLAH